MDKLPSISNNKAILKANAIHALQNLRSSTVAEGLWKIRYLNEDEKQGIISVFIYFQIRNISK